MVPELVGRHIDRKSEHYPGWQHHIGDRMALRSSTSYNSRKLHNIMTRIR